MKLVKMLQRKAVRIVCLLCVLLKFGNGLEYLKYFMKVENSSLRGGSKLMEYNDIDEFICSKKCFQETKCNSFLSNMKSPRCILYRDDSTERRLIKADNYDFYQLRRNVPVYGRYIKCPVDVIYNTVLYYANDLANIDGHNYTECFSVCETTPTCQSFDFNTLSNKCYLSSENHKSINLNFFDGWIYTELNRTLWSSFSVDRNLEEVNSVGCGVRTFNSYYFDDNKQVNDLVAYSSYSFKQNSFHNLVTQSRKYTFSQLDCSRLCLISPTCTAFSYIGRKCTLKEFVLNSN